MTDHSRAIQELTAEYDALKKRIHELEAMEVDRKQDEESLRRSKEKYRLLYSSMRDGFVYLDMDGTFMECNPAFEEMIGYKLQELKNLTFTDITPEKWQAYDEEAVRRLRQTGDSEAGQKEFRRKNGVIFPVEIRATLLRDDDGKPSGFGAIVRDITERMQAEVALRKSEERYRLIAENTADTIAMFDLNLKPTYISHSILNLRGYTVREAMKQTWNEILTPDSLERATKMFADQMALESSGTADPARSTYLELEENCKDGSTIWVEHAASFLRDSNLKPTGILTVTRNITARKLAEMELQKTLERLRKSIAVTIQVMVSAIEVRDPYTAGHQMRVADLARSIATEMGLNKDKIEGIRMAGSIHDIGKLAIPSEILAKPTKLTDLEFSLIKEHSQSGYEMLKNVESPWPLAEILYQHHERMNGSGYPRKLKGEEIIIEARIIAVADVVEAMASHRPYRPGLGLDAALEEIEKNKGIAYDNDVVDACLRLFREKGYQLT